jgi:protein TonB
MPNLNKFVLCFFVSILLHASFFYAVPLVFSKKGKPVYLFTPVDVTFYSPSINSPSIKTAANTETVKASSEEKLPKAKEEKKEPAKIKGDLPVVKKTIKEPIKKVETTKKTKITKKLPSNVSNVSNVSVESSQSQQSKSSSKGDGCLYTSASFDTGNFKYPYYTNQIRRKIESQWHWVENYANLRVLLHFTINKDGSVNDISIKESSGNNDYDENAVNSVRRAAPFSELPDGYESNSLSVFFEFKC